MPASSSDSSKPLQGKVIGFVLTFFLFLIGFILCYCLGDEDCKDGAKKMLIIDIVLYIIAIVLVVVATCVAGMAAY